MGKKRINIGILLSQSGTYEAMSRASLAGVLQGVAEVNADDALAFTFEPQLRDPKGDLAAYAPQCRELLNLGGLRHIFGCITSASRKEIIPELERHDGTLWYPVPYEGFEASEHVAYMHACPNQHIVPLLTWALQALGKRGYLVGSNYVWGWEIARIAREYIQKAGGQVLGDRSVPLHQSHLPHILAEIDSLKPDFILNSMVGESSYQLMRDLAAHYGKGKGPKILSCNFTEAEIPKLGPAAEGLISVGPWFAPSPAASGNALAERARQSVHELARLLQIVPEGERLKLSDLIKAAAQRGYRSALASDTLHASLPVVIARLEGNVFRELKRFAPREADPYLSRHQEDSRPLPYLRVVS